MKFSFCSSKKNEIELKNIEKNEKCQDLNIHQDEDVMSAFTPEPVV